MSFMGDNRAAQVAHVTAEIRDLCPWLAPHEVAALALGDQRVTVGPAEVEAVFTVDRGRAFVVGEGSA